MTDLFDVFLIFYLLPPFICFESAFSSDVKGVCLRSVRWTERLKFLIFFNLLNHK